MKRSLLSLLLAAAVGCCAFAQPAPTVTEDVASKDVRLLLTMKDGTTKTLLFRYLGSVAKSKDTIGKEVSFLNPIDTRKINLNLSTKVDRWFLPEGSSLQSFKGQTSEVVAADNKNITYRNFSFFHGNDRSQEIATDYANAKTSLVSNFDSLVNADKDGLISEIMKLYDAKSVTVVR
jgi:hypothetical protein